MALIKINGVDIPSPSSYNVGIYDISEAERNANGTIIIERIATKRKIELGWNMLTQNETSRLLSLVSEIFFSVEYSDPQSGGNKAGVFYCGDRSAPMVSFANGNPIYKDVKFNLIER